jgi:hypothetical protein
MSSMVVRILGNLRSHPMTAADFGRVALSLERMEEYSHAGLPAFVYEAGNLLDSQWLLIGTCASLSRKYGAFCVPGGSSPTLPLRD